MAGGWPRWFGRWFGNAEGLTMPVIRPSRWFGQDVGPSLSKAGCCKFGYGGPGCGEPGRGRPERIGFVRGAGGRSRSCASLSLNVNC